MIKNSHFQSKKGFGVLMRIFKRIGIILLIALLPLSACSCKKQIKSSGYNKNSDVASVSSQIIAQNENMQLFWNNETKSVSFVELSGQNKWSNIPLDVIEQESSNVILNSTLNIQVNSNNNLTDIRGYIGAFQNGRISSEIIKNGIKITYYFDEYEISVPVEYVLRETSVAASVKAKDIIENGDYVVTSVSICPNLVSTENIKQGGYLFVPAGSGAIMYVAETVEGTKEYECDVYGSDESDLVTVSTKRYPKAYLPVFGVKSGDSALCGIIEEGAESVRLHAESGNARTKHSSVYPEFFVRSSDNIVTQGNDATSSDVRIWSEEISQSEITVGYYPLSGNNADYSGMAQTYKKYLKDNGLLKTNNKSNGNYAVTLYGGVESKETFLGIPQKRLQAMTTFTEAQKIVKELKDSAKAPASVRLLGYGNNGISPGKIAGGYSFSSKYGSDKQFKAFEKYCKDNNVNVYTDFDIVRFSSSGSGFSVLSGTAKSATLRKTVKYMKNLPLGDDDKDSSYHLLGRALIPKATDKLISFCDKYGISGISLSTFGSVAYSDHNKIKYAVKSNIAGDVIKQADKISKSGHKLAFDNANAYAAAVADAVYNVPIDNGGYIELDESVPFYQMVFSGAKPLYSTSVNLTDNFDKQIMLCAAYGMKPEFSLIGNYSNKYMKSSLGEFRSMLYSDNIGLIKSYLEKNDALFSLINCQSIKSFEHIYADLYKTVYENGTVVITNHSEKEATFGSQIIKPYGILFEGGDAG